MTDTRTLPAPPTQQPPSGRAARPLAITVAVVGGLVGVATIVQGGLAAWPVPPTQQVVLDLTATDLADATSLDLDVGSADVTVAFADVDDATLTIEAPDADRWRLDVAGGTIDVGDPDGWWSWDWALGWGERERTATLVLPASLEGDLDGDLAIGAGSIDVAGSWRDLALHLASGRATVDAAATWASIDVASGSADVDLVVDGDVAFELASGEIVTTLEHTGDLSVSVATGSVVGRLVGGPYAVTTDVAVGDADVAVEQRDDAEQAIVVDLATGSVRLTDG